MEKVTQLGEGALRQEIIVEMVEQHATQTNNCLIFGW